jgi:hypothetical protein
MYICDFYLQSLASLLQLYPPPRIRLHYSITIGNTLLPLKAALSDKIYLNIKSINGLICDTWLSKALIKKILKLLPYFF